jgi:hypothetical protein
VFLTSYTQFTGITSIYVTTLLHTRKPKLLISMLSDVCVMWFDNLTQQQTRMCIQCTWIMGWTFLCTPMVEHLSYSSKMIIHVLLSCSSTDGTLPISSLVSHPWINAGKFSCSLPPLFLSHPTPLPALCQWLNFFLSGGERGPIKCLLFDFSFGLLVLFISFCSDIHYSKLIPWHKIKLFAI